MICANRIWIVATALSLAPAIGLPAQIHASTPAESSPLQMLAQAMVGVARHAPGRRVVAAHMVFARSADAAQSLRFVVSELSAGRSKCLLVVKADRWPHGWRLAPQF